MAPLSSVSVSRLLALAALACVTGWLIAAAPASASSRCTGSVTGGHAPGITLHTYDFVVTDLGCARARTVVGAFLKRKLSQNDERCAGRADNPPYRGCIIDGFRCRALGPSRVRHGHGVAPEACTDGRRRVRFKEYDRSAN